MDRKFTTEEIAEYNGENGKPMYVVVDGDVYDVTGSRLWKNGKHMNRHVSGRDLSVELKAAPHGKDVFKREGIKQVGVLIKEKEEKDHLPFFLSKIFKLFPILRRHIHPIMVHFPTAYIIAGALFLILDFFGAGRFAPFKNISFIIFLLGVFFTPFAILSGLLTWWVNYSCQTMHQIKRKIQLSLLLILLEGGGIYIKVFGTFETEKGLGLYIYSGLLFLMVINISFLGYYGGQLVFPYEKE